MSENSLQQLSQLGQSLWYDNIERSLLIGGELNRLVKEDYVTGLTSNPTIFQKAIAISQAYDYQLKTILAQSPMMPIKELYEHLAIEDIQHAADILWPVYERTKWADGYVSLEVSPQLANDMAGTIAEAKRLYTAVHRPNLMIKIPATSACLEAITEVIAAGINVNATLMFSLSNYIEVAEAYIAGLEKLATTRKDLSGVASVASFFISRVDSLVDKLLTASGQPTANTLLGQTAIANGRVVYQEFKKIFGSERFKKLADKGARVQRPLWASTSTKNPNYRDVLYIEELIGESTVNTAPPETIQAFKAHGQARLTVETHLEEAQALFEQLKQLGISYDDATRQLQEEGVTAFANSFVTLLNTLETKRKSIITR